MHSTRLESPNVYVKKIYTVWRRHTRAFRDHEADDRISLVPSRGTSVPITSHDLTGTPRRIMELAWKNHGEVEGLSLRDSDNG